jgi:hypothetical protein
MGYYLIEEKPASPQSQEFALSPEVFGEILNRVRVASEAGEEEVTVKDATGQIFKLNTKYAVAMLQYYIDGQK